MNQNVGYFKQAWLQLKAEPGWAKPLLILGIVSWIPIVGQIFAMGYIFEWARDGAWGMTQGFPRKVGELGKYGRYGLIWFIGSLVWGIAGGLVGGLLGIIPLIGSLASVVVSIAVAIMVDLLALRAVIYDEYGAVFQINRVWPMVKADASRLLGIFGWYFLWSLLVSLIVGLIVGIASVPLAGSFISNIDVDSLANTGSTIAVYQALINAFLSAGPGFMALVIVMGMIVTIISVFLNAVVIRGYGLWMGQFGVAEWSDSDKPAPFELRGKQQPYQQPYQPYQAPQQQPGQPTVAYYDPQTGQPVYSGQVQPGQPVGYDPATGQPIYSQPVQPEQPAKAPEIVGYDTQTGAPIYAQTQQPEAPKDDQE